MIPVKLIMLGDGAVGKTSMLITYTTYTFPEEHIPTVFDNYNVTVVVDDTKVNLGLWDTEGGEDYDRLRPLLYPQTDVFVICYSVTRRQSFENISSKWQPEVRQFCPGVPYILVATKTDVREDSEQCDRMRRNGTDIVTTEEGIELAKQIGAAAFVECSSIQQKNLKRVYVEAVRAALKYKRDKKLDKVEPKKNVKNDCDITYRCSNDVDSKGKCVVV